VDPTERVLVFMCPHLGITLAHLWALRHLVTALEPDSPSAGHHYVCLAGDFCTQSNGPKITGHLPPQEDSPREHNNLFLLSIAVHVCRHAHVHRHQDFLCIFHYKAQSCKIEIHNQSVKEPIVSSSRDNDCSYFHTGA
jgi:hypothetical protein